MDAGRHVDVLVAAYVMGWAQVRQYHTAQGVADRAVGIPPPGLEPRLLSYGREHETDVPFFSTDLADGWLIIDKLTKDGYEVDTHIRLNTKAKVVISRERHSEWSATGQTITHALCLAVLKVVGYEQHEFESE